MGVRIVQQPAPIMVTAAATTSTASNSSSSSSSSAAALQALESSVRLAKVDFHLPGWEMPICMEDGRTCAPPLILQITIDGSVQSCHAVCKLTQGCKFFTVFPGVRKCRLFESCA